MIRRIVGIETEFGITSVGGEGARSLGPDEIARYLFRPVVERWRSSNVFLENGARLYLDVGSHPEYATAECDGLRQLVAHDRAGERIVDDLAVHAEQSLAADGIDAKVYLFKNNTDSAGNSYGCHENYLLDRSTQVRGIATDLLPFLVTRQFICGAGKILTGPPSGGVGGETLEPTYCFSQRAEHMWDGVSSATTRSRPLINTRDEPHAPDEMWRRLHVIIGDANLAEHASYLKFGTTCLVLDAIEAGVDFADLVPVDPVEAVHRISHDPTLTATVRMTDGRELTGLALQREILARVAGVIGDGAGRPAWAPEVLAAWREILDDLEADPMSCADRLDWPAKLRLLEGFRTRDQLGWDHARLALIDVQYHDIDPERGLYNRLVAKGAMRRLLTDEEVDRATVTPPESTRAWARGRFVAELGDRVLAAGWDHVVVTDSRGEKRSVDLSDPYAGSRAHCEAEPDLVSPDGPSPR